MMKLNNGGKLPDKFKIANQEITVIIEDSLPNNDYGYFCDATNTIKLARTVKSEYEGNVSMSDEQLRNTFYHELFHVFQFYYNNEFNEIRLKYMLTLCVNLQKLLKNHFKNIRNEVIKK